MLAIFRDTEQYKAYRGVIVNVLAADGLRCQVEREDKGTIFGDLRIWAPYSCFLFLLSNQEKE